MKVTWQQFVRKIIQLQPSTIKFKLPEVEYFGEAKFLVLAAKQQNCAACSLHPVLMNSTSMPLRGKNH